MYVNTKCPKDAQREQIDSVAQRSVTEHNRLWHVCQDEGIDVDRLIYVRWLAERGRIGG